MLPGTMGKQAVNWTNRKGADDSRAAFALVENLLASRLCQGLKWDEVSRLSESAELRYFSPLHEAVSEGTAPTEIYVVVRGRFIVLLPTQQLDQHGSGAIVNLDSFICGDCFGQAGLVDDLALPASIVATEPSEVVALPLDAINSLAAEDQRVGQIIFRNLFSIQTRRLSLLSG